jgi:hypothetical protein
MARASYSSIIDWMETALNPDLFVMPSRTSRDRTAFSARWPGAGAWRQWSSVQMVRDAVSCSADAV